MSTYRRKPRPDYAPVDVKYAPYKAIGIHVQLQVLALYDSITDENREQTIAAVIARALPTDDIDLMVMLSDGEKREDFEPGDFTKYGDPAIYRIARKNVTKYLWEQAEKAIDEKNATNKITIAVTEEEFY